VENASYGATICAERAAALAAVCAGERALSAVAVASAGGAAYPCGICRQFLREFCEPAEMAVYVYISPEAMEEYTLAELLPRSFGL